MNIKSADFYVEHIITHVQSIQEMPRVEGFPAQELIDKEMELLKVKLGVLIEIARVQGIILGTNLVMKSFITSNGLSDAIDTRQQYTKELDSLYRELLKAIEEKDKE
jgi:hypothetical protein